MTALVREGDGDMAGPEQSTDKFKLRRHRHGVCHRCGWRGPVVKIGRRDRALLRTSEAYGRLCEGCIDDLLRGHVPLHGAVAPETVERKATGDFDVA
ncbi:MAG: hypothetical protein ACLPR9_19900 [Acidimicrobiales bacterium]